MQVEPGGEGRHRAWMWDPWDGHSLAVAQGMTSFQLTWFLTTEDLDALSVLSKLLKGYLKTKKSQERVRKCWLAVMSSMNGIWETSGVFEVQRT